ncbi:MAG: transglutaminase-like domain-containing protein [Burkholderiales bacterium]
MHLEAHAATRAQSIPLAAGDAGTAQTIAAMRRLIEEGKKDPAVHETAATILQGVRAFDWNGERRAIYEWVRRNIRFTRDVYGKETLHSAREILRLRIGDCDDYTVLLCALLATVGHKTRIVTISSNDEDPEQFSHVYPEVFAEGTWIAIDAARRNPAYSLAPERFHRKRIWDTSSPEYVDVAGLNGMSSVNPRPGALPSAYRADVYPLFRQPRAIPLRGLGHYGRRRVRDLGVDWSEIADVITAGGQTTANIIAASRASPYNLYPTTGAGVAQRVPYGGVIQPTPGGGIFAGGINPTWLLLGGGLLLVVMLRGR